MTRKSEKTEIPYEIRGIFEAAGIPEPGKYVRLFAGKSFVVKCGGSLIESGEVGEMLLDDIAAMFRLGIRPVLVHGGSVQADREIEEAGIPSRRVRGLRVTCDRTLEIVSRCFGQLNGRVVKRLRGRGVEAVGFGAGEVIRAERLVMEGEDIGNVGMVAGVEDGPLKSAMEKGVPVIASLGTGPDGGLLNINADYVATRLAVHISAEKLVLLTDVDGVMTDPSDDSTLISTLTVSEARRLIDSGVIASGMIPKVESAVEVVEGGLPKVHMINGRTSHSLLVEVFTDRGCGTQIVP
ncbi:MAG: acetylglutamate kinase [bacterium]